MNSSLLLSLPNIIFTGDSGVNPEDNTIIFYGESEETSQVCPQCHRATSTVKNRYTRTLQDLPMSGHTVKLILRVHKFECLNPECKQHEFTERLPFAEDHARRTKRLDKIILETAIHQSDLSASKVLKLQGIDINHDSINELLKKNNQNRLQ